jgi:tetratricopeptide (TPR) repeat protein
LLTMHILKYLFFILLLATAYRSNAHDQIDSLKDALSSSTKDSVKFKILGALSWNYILKNELDVAYQYADSIRMLAEKIKDDEWINYAHFYYGVIARHRGNHAMALEHLNQYVNHHQISGDSIKVAYGLYQIGSTYSTMGSFEKSLPVLFRILEIYKSTGSEFDIGYTLNGIGVAYKNLERHEEAIRTYKEALAIYDKINAREDQANVLGNLANAYMATRQFEEAKNCFRSALLIDESLGNEKWIAYDLENIGVMHNHLGNYDSALYYQLKSLDIRSKLPGKHEYAYTLQQVGHTYFLLKEYSRARQNLRKSYELAREIQAKPVLRDAYLSMAQVFAAENNFKEAYAYQQMYNTIKDSIINEKVNQQLSELQTKYETAEKEKQISLLANKMEIQEKEVQLQSSIKKALLAGIVLILLLAVSIIFTIRQRFSNQNLVAEKNKQISDALFQHQMSELEMKALRAQINPHFFFNCMNSINRLILEEDIENASRYLTKFSIMVRLILEHSETSQISLKDELMMLKSYIQLEELRFKEKINFSISIDDGIEPENRFLPPMILQPFVENAIWHGLIHRETKGNGQISILIKEFNNLLYFTIEDNGVGREKSRLIGQNSVWKSKSLGIKITEDRLRLLNKEKLRELIRITDLKDDQEKTLGTRVDIHIPMA